MDQTFLNLIALIVDLTNKVNALQQENTVLKDRLPKLEEVRDEATA